jgi:hypothetical protein
MLLGSHVPMPFSPLAPYVSKTQESNLMPASRVVLQTPSRVLAAALIDRLRLAHPPQTIASIHLGSHGPRAADIAAAVSRALTHAHVGLDTLGCVVDELDGRRVLEVTHESALVTVLVPGEVLRVFNDRASSIAVLSPSEADVKVWAHVGWG